MPQQRFLPPILILCIFAVAATSTDCYDYSGNIYAGQRPCHLDREVSNCCSFNDYCLDNGLCLDAGGNNYYSQQGCTDPAFGDPCNIRCSTDNSDGSQHGSYHLLWLCVGDVGAYCCGPDSSCCFNSTVEQMTLGKYTAVTRAPSASSEPVYGTMTPSTATATMTLMNTATKTASAAAKTITAAAQTKDNFSAGIGAGLGIGVFFTVIAGTIGFCLGKRKPDERNKSTTKNNNEGGPPNNNNPNTTETEPVANPQYSHAPYQYTQLFQAQELPDYPSR